MATVNFCADGLVYLELTEADRRQATYTAAGQMFLALNPDDAEHLAEAASHALEEREGFSGVH